MKQIGIFLMAVGIVLGVISCSGSGTKQIDRNTAPSVPVNPLPDDGATRVSTSISLQWDSCADAEDDQLAYSLYFGDDAAGMRMLAGDLSSCLYQLSGLKPDTRYYWRIEVTDGTETVAGPVWTFETDAESSVNTPPTVAMTSPADTAENIALGTRLRWQGADIDNDELVYDVYYGPAGAIELAARNITADSWSPPAQSGDTWYYWEIVAKDGRGGESRRGTVWSFKTASQQNHAPSIPITPEPLDGAIAVPTTIRLDWADSADSDGDEVTYRVYLGKSETSLVCIETANETSECTVTGLLNNTGYFWRVISVDEHGAEAAGAVWRFTTSPALNLPPSVPSDPAPADAATGLGTSASLRWSASTDPENDPIRYDVYFGTDPVSMTLKQSDIAIGEVSVRDLEYSTDYYWKAVAKDDKGNSTEGPVWHFSTGSSQYAYPGNVAVKHADQTFVTIRFDKVNGASGYTIYCSPASGGALEKRASVSASVSDITIHYRTAWETPRIHYQSNGGAWTKAPGVPMEQSGFGPDFAAKSIAASTLVFVFNDGYFNNSPGGQTTVWDNNDTKNYTITSPGVYEVANKVITAKSGVYVSAKGLNPGTGYRFAVRAEYPGGYSALSPAVAATTADYAAFKPWSGPFLTWGEGVIPQNGVLVNFLMPRAVKAQVEYRKKAPLGVWQKTAEPEFSMTDYSIRLENLQADTQYEYRLCADGVVSETWAFRTAPENPTSFKFIIIGDNQDEGDNEQWSPVAAAIKNTAEQEGVSFFIHTGDMTPNDDAVSWKRFFDKGKAIFSSYVTMPVVGNHDTPTYNSNTDTSSFHRHFSLYGTKDYYTWQYGSARFISLFSEKPSVFAPGGEQYTFAQNIIQNSGSSNWRFAYWHIPPHNIGGHYASSYAVLPITQLFDGAVDWVFCGHEHRFQRFKPLRYRSLAQGDGQLPLLAPSGNYGTGSADGVGYLVMPSSGQWPRMVTKLQNYIDAGILGQYSKKMETGYALVAVQDRRIRLTVYGMDWTNIGGGSYIIDDPDAKISAGASYNGVDYTKQ